MKFFSILIVDDELAHLESLINAIKQTGTNYKILRANSAEMALKIIAKDVPDLIITDWDMPGMNGIEMISKIKNQSKYADIPVIVCTGIMTTSKHLKIALDAGANDYIRKPVDPVELEARIHSLLKYAESQRKLAKSEELHRTLIDNLGEGVGITDLHEKILFANPAAETIFAVLKDELIGRNLKEFISEQQTIYFLEQRKARMDGKTSQYEMEITRNNGEVRNLLVSAAPHKDNENKIVGTYAVFRDITERKKTEIALMKSEEQLRILNDDKDRFMSILAHDLRNPFSNLLGFSELLVNDIDDIDFETIKNRAAIINQSAQTIYDLLEDLLIWSNSQAGKLPFAPEEISHPEICDEIIYVLQNSAKVKNISIKSIAVPDLIIFADNNMYKTVIRNLLSNAIKFTNVNGQIHIRAEIIDTNVQITVADNGVGISLEKLENLWDFSHFHATKGTNGEKGSGLGLILCREFVEKHNGKIWCESEVGKGSKFKFTLPDLI